jgi:hypothetical protein
MRADQHMHDLRREAHELGVEGSPKMDEGGLRAAIEAAREGKSPEAAKQAGKQASP